jgi:thioesterase domain-containing protein/acyl carrier protein
VELKLLSVWESLLNHQPISVTDDFFNIGGTSMAAIRLFTKIEKQFNRKLQPISLLKHRTIRALAELIKDETKDEPWSALVPLRASGSKPPLFCLHAGGGHVFYLKDLAKHLGADQPVYALQKLGLNEDEPVIYSVKTMASHYLSEIRKVQPKGPYSIIGYCQSAPICYEIAIQLNKIGEVCALVGIIDSKRTPNYAYERTFKENLYRLLKMIRRNDFSFVSSILRRRLITPIRGRWASLVANQQSKKELDLWDMQNLILDEYVWEPYPGQVTLIATKQSQEDRGLEYLIEGWTPLAKGGLDVFVVPGDHGYIFFEPEVKHLAEQLRQCLDKANK